MLPGENAKHNSHKITIATAATISFAIAIALLTLLLPKLIDEFYIWQLSSANPARRAAAVERLGQRKVARAVPFLARMIIEGEQPIGGAECPDNFVLNRQALDAIRSIGTPALVSLRELFNQTDDPLISAGILIAAVQLKEAPNDVRQLLMVGLTHNDPQVKRTAKWGLSTIDSDHH